MATPSPQSYPTSKIKIGAVMYSCAAWTDDMGKTVTEINEWVVRSIQAKRGTKSRMGFSVYGSTDKSIYVNLTKKVDHLTWGKRSNKTGDFGWRKTIPSACREQFKVGDKLPLGLYTTVRAALVYAVAKTTESINWYTAMIEKETDGEILVELKGELVEFEAEHTALKRRLAKLDNLRTKNKPQAAVVA